MNCLNTFSLGKPESFQIDGTTSFVNHKNPGENHPYFRIIDLKSSYKPFPGHFFSSYLHFNDIRMNIFNKETSGFKLTDILDFYYNLNYNITSNDGVIHIQPDDYDLTFYQGPLLNKGQISFNTTPTIYHRYEDQLYLNYDGHIMYGLLDNLNIHLKYRAPDEWERQPSELMTGGKFRYKLFFSEVDISQRYDNIFSDFFRETSNFKTHANMGLLIGKRALSIRNIAANYNQFFNSNIGHHQILLTFNYDNPGTGERTFSFRSKYGVFDQLTVGGTYALKSNFFEQDESSVEMAYSNFPLQELRPSELSPIIYTHGYLLPSGVIKAKILLAHAYNGRLGLHLISEARLGLPWTLNIDGKYTYFRNTRFFDDIFKYIELGVSKYFSHSYINIKYQYIFDSFNEYYVVEDYQSDDVSFTYNWIF
ncbi:MAG: hypothetical protein HQK83_07070 [Fibrobacteria bacterium]|nr:hypothetical protein [Fibrobacteria bacterium]